MGLNLFLIPGSSMLLALSSMLLSCLYFCASIPLFNKVPLKAVFIKQSYSEINGVEILLAFLGGYISSVVLVGILFKFLYLPGATIMLTVSVIPVCIIAIISLIRFFTTKKRNYLGIFVRTCVVGAIGLTLMILPSGSIMEFKHRDNPAFIKALNDSRDNPQDEELRKKYNEELEKL